MAAIVAAPDGSFPDRYGSFFQPDRWSWELAPCQLVLNLIFLTNTVKYRVKGAVILYPAGKLNTVASEYRMNSIRNGLL